MVLRRGNRGICELGGYRRLSSGRSKYQVQSTITMLADGLDVPVAEFFSGLGSSAPGKIGKPDRGEAEE